MKVLMVCLGNICRSPMADGLLKRKAKEQNLNIIVDSAGTANYHINKAPDERMIQIGAKNLTPIDGLRARQFKKVDFEEFDRIYVMDRNNFTQVLELADGEAQRKKVKYLLSHLFPNQDKEVPDPYYGNMSDFQAVYNLLDQAIDALVDDIR